MNIIHLRPFDSDEDIGEFNNDVGLEKENSESDTDESEPEDIEQNLPSENVKEMKGLKVDQRNFI